jgi:hypothetical protein
MTGLNNYLLSKGMTANHIGHHEFMSQYVNAIAHSLYQWDLRSGSKGNISLSYMKDLAWGGLTGYLDPDTNQYVRYDAFVQFAQNSNTVMNRIESIIYNEKANVNSQSVPCN